MLRQSRVSTVARLLIGLSHDNDYVAEHALAQGRVVLEKVPLCVIGCGRVGHRHLLGYKELEESGIGNIDVVAVCDVQPQNADLGAREVERLFGKKPMVFTHLDDVRAHSEIAAVDVVTDPSSHHTVAVPALEAGKHAMVEKPLGITIRACRAMTGAAKRSGVVLATAENYRRDPVNRLVRGIIEEGLLGDPYYMVHNTLGGNDLIRNTPWRHLMDKGAIGLEYGVHMADIVQYYMGECEEVYGRGMIVEPVRRRPDREESSLESYQARFKTLPDSIQATGEDSVIAMYKMRSGAMVAMAYISAGRGSMGFERSVHGRWGAIYSPGDRNGNPVILRRENQKLLGQDILPLLPNFQMSEITERLFGKRAVVYDLPFRSTDAKLMAIEFHDYGRAILQGGQPEVDGFHGTTAVATILGAYVSALAGRAVSMRELLSGEVRAYQVDIDEVLGLEKPETTCG